MSNKYKNGVIGRNDCSRSFQRYIYQPLERESVPGASLLFFGFFLIVSVTEETGLQKLLVVLFQQPLGVDDVFEALLGFEARRGEDAAVQIPETEAFQVGGAAFVIQDEGRDAVAQALFEHQQPPDPSVPVVEGPNAFKAHVEIQDLQQGHFLQVLIFTKQLAHLGVDVLGRRGFQLIQIVGCSTVRPNAALATALGESTIEHQVVQPLDVGLGQRLGGSVDDVIHTEHMVSGLNEIVHLDGFKAGLDLVRLEDLRDLREHQPVAGHASVAVGEVGLHVVIQAMEHFLGFLLSEFLD